MSKLHVLAGKDNTYTIVVHGAVSGSNSAGKTWASVLVASGRNTSVLNVGTGPGETDQTEMDSIIAGTTMEGVFAFTDNPSWNSTQRNAELDAQATSCLAQTTARLTSELKWYGAVRT